MSHDQGWAAPGGPERSPGDATGDRSGPPASWPGAAPAPQGESSGGQGPAAPGQGWGLPPGAGAAWSAPQRPGIVPLRPLGVFELFEGGFRAISANPKVMLGVSAVVFGAVAVLSLLLAPLFGGALASLLNDTLTAPGQPSPGLDAFDLAGADPVTTLVSFVATIALTGVLVLSVSGSVVGREIRAGALWQRVKGRVLPLVGLALLQTLLLGLVLLVPAAVGALGFLVSTGAGVTGLVLGLLVGAVLLVWLGVRWNFASVVLLLEQRGVVASLRRSARLVRGTWWRVLGVLALTLVVTGLATAVLVGPASLVAGVITAVGPGSGGASAAASFITLLFSTLASILVVPFSSAVTALLYTDLRIRQEGLDVELARAAEASS